ncbi:MAG: DUF1802 family protein [Nostoc sp. DedQUE04]|uniref:DUF1802 family protein n=1 Tax=Nostoc sp. DedQUE04 TaxID=3075390 RepID=UPI002AD4EFA7|nr:DUF1802 family protein [Nostoc sp. DedQUE04]MDZ8139943.1 DUF1802 family protein [Nostoc sp. DedQUE04]
MSNLLLLNTALCLPSPDVEGLLQGRIIIALPRTFIQPGRSFALYPSATSINVLPDEKYYKSNLLTITQKVIPPISSETVWIQSWGKCELCQIVNHSESLKALSQLNIWTTKGLQEILLQRKHIFLAYLRVYLLSQPIEISVNPQSQFIGLPDPLKVSVDLPVLNDRTFTQRKRQLEKLEPPLNPELEELQSAIASLAISQPAAKQLDEEIKVFLGWSSEKLIKQPDPNLAWIYDIAKLGDRSIELEEKKTNYQAGTDFENVVRDSLELLGFTIDYAHKGGAGGLDLFCSKPYPLFGECKAGRKIPNDTAVQLLNLGMLRRPDLFNQAAKLIIGPGEPTPQLQDAAKIQGMSIIKPETLQKLVKLQSNHCNSVDLFKLKEYLKAGQSDEEVEKYIDQVYTDISLRSQIITAVKELSEQDNETAKTIRPSFTVTEIRVHYNATHNPRLNDEVVHDLIIELSSPLTGYLGRIKGSDWKSDRFYFLRNLSIN